MNPDFQPALEKALGGQVERLTRLSGGASQETWSFDAAGEPFILRRSPGGGERATTGSSAVTLETEAVVIEAARAAGVKAPRVRYVLTPEDGAGHGYVMERLSGETIARKILRDAE